ncbi:hypothetical protein QVD17_25055 [Tagetes erecta]|uniref:Reverse transcriptase zinc-binding domain-containing protein n=1 Tax=Tagetes erecta TaxID=13708 RepID=A0AAD8KG39_TARER|nr:hypothetical protein QVD17_25055 [Tagetes erecta]
MPRKVQSIPFKASISAGWKQIMQSKMELLYESINLDSLLKGAVGCGSKIGFWADCWVLNYPLMDAFPALFALDANKRCKVRQRVGWSGPNVTWSWEWKRRLRGAAEEEQLQQLKEVIGNYEFGISSDKWVWLGDESGKYSVKSLRYIIDYNRLPSDLNPMSWCHWIPLKVRCFMWRARLDRIPAKTGLIARGVGIGGGSCSLCIGTDESHSHLLISCPFASRVWDKVAEWCGVSRLESNGLRDVKVITEDEVGSNKLKMAHCAIYMATCWYIWLARNDRIFNGIPVAVQNVVDKVKVHVFMWLKARAKLVDLAWHKWCNFSFSNFPV